MKNILLLSLILISITACNSGDTNTPEQKKANTFIEGTIKKGKDKVIYFEELRASSVSLLDSIILDESGKFKFGADVKNQSFYRIKATDENSLVLILTKGETAKINADIKNLQTTAIVSNSPETERIQLLNDKEYKLYVTNDSLKRELMKFQQLTDVNGYVRTQNAHTSMLDERMSFIKNFIDQNPASLASLAAVERLDKEQDFAYYKKVADALKKVMPESEYYKNLESRITEWGKLAIGGKAPEIVLNSPNGKSIALSSLQGEVVLIDFWASWCKPCRAENPNVVKMYNKYKNKGFEIYSVSLDKNHGAWTNAIKKDGLIWSNHVSDLKFWQSAAVKLYDVKGIPLTYLIDKEGNIIAKNLRGEALEAKLKELFGA